MKLMFKNSKFAIFDDVLPQDSFDKVWTHVQMENYSAPLISGSWVKVWRMGDNQPLGSAEYKWSKRPFKNYMDLIGHFFMEIAKNTPDICSEEGVWDDMTLRSYLYPRGTKLSWHNDAENYTGAFTYYIHPKWGSTWGGELMVAEVPSMSEMKKKPVVGPHLDHEWEDSYIAERGVGQWITPKPNRCVVMTGGTYHSVNRVDPDAGDHTRASIVGFLLRSKNGPQPRIEEDSMVDLEIKTIEGMD
jgi:hypothetical protein